MTLTCVAEGFQQRAPVPCLPEWWEYSRGKDVQRPRPAGLGISETVSEGRRSEPVSDPYRAIRNIKEVITSV